MRGRGIGQPGSGPQNQLALASGVGSAGESHAQTPSAKMHVAPTFVHVAFGVIAESALGQLDGFGPASQSVSCPKSTAPAHLPPLHTTTSLHPYSQSRLSCEQLAPSVGRDSGHTALHGADESTPPSVLPSVMPPHAVARRATARTRMARSYATVSGCAGERVPHGSPSRNRRHKPACNPSSGPNAGKKLAPNAAVARADKNIATRGENAKRTPPPSATNPGPPTCHA